MLRRVLAVLLVLGAIVASPDVFASYTESKVTSEDVRAVVQRDGSMAVTHALGVRVLAGALRSFAVSGFDRDLELRPTAAVVAADGSASTASVVRDDAGVVHVTVDDPRGLKHGDYRFELVYDMSLAGRVTRDGAFDRVRFSFPPMRDGVDGARLVLDLPAAPTEPRAGAPGEDAPDLVTLRRSAGRDQLELVRPHVAKGEPATFFARVDPKALSAMPGAAPPEASAAPIRPVSPRVTFAAEVTVAFAALFVFALALAKGRLVAAAVPDASPVGLVPLPSGARAALAAALFGAGVYLEVRGHALGGSSLVAASMPLLAWRFSPAVRRARAPGSWLVVKPEEALVRGASRADLLDATTPRGALLLAVFAAACAAASSFGAGPSTPYFVALDALVLVPLFFTGTSRQLPPSGAREGTALAPVARALARACSVKVAPLARVTGGAPAFDEVRLLASPRLAMAGTNAIEIGVAWQRARGASVPSFDVLVRVHDGTFAAAKMAAAFPELRALPGRRPEERVFRFEPDGPWAQDAASLVTGLAETLRDRRLALPSPAKAPAGERRAPPNARRAAA